MAISYKTDEALQMLVAGWKVRFTTDLEFIQWRSPDGVSGDSWKSESLDNAPWPALEYALKIGHVIHRDRRPSDV